LNTSRKKKINIQNQKIKTVVESGSPAGLAKSKKIIRTMNERESQFLKLCSQIRLNNSKNERAENQKNERKAKRN
jgi:hypothetical protein